MGFYQFDNGEQKSACSELRKIVIELKKTAKIAYFVKYVLLFLKLREGLFGCVMSLLKSNGAYKFDQQFGNQKCQKPAQYELRKCIDCTFAKVVKTTAQLS